MRQQERMNSNINLRIYTMKASPEYFPNKAKAGFTNTIWETADLSRQNRFHPDRLLPTWALAGN